MIRHIMKDWPEWGLDGPMPGVSQYHLLPDGLTNRCWRLDLPHQSVVIRVSAANTRLLDIDRGREYQLQQWAASHGLAPKVLYRSFADRYWVMEYVEGREANLQSDLFPLSTRLQKLHRLTPPESLPAWQLIEKADVYWRTLSQRLQMQWSSWEPLKQQLQQAMDIPVTDERCICHMDPNPHNWRLTGKGWQLLDWEYATFGPRQWDLASFAQSCKLDAHQLARWCRLHKIEPDDPAWRVAQLQFRYLAELWFGVQGLKSDQQLEAALRQLLDDVLLQAPQ